MAHKQDKNRNGPTCDITLAYVREYTRPLRDKLGRGASQL